MPKEFKSLEDIQKSDIYRLRTRGTAEDKEWMEERQTYWYNYARELEFTEFRKEIAARFYPELLKDKES